MKKTIAEKIIELQIAEKIIEGLPFGPRDNEKRKENEKGKSKKEMEAIDEDILFLRSIKTNHIAHYATKDEEIVIVAEARRVLIRLCLKQNTIDGQVNAKR